jgi:hypothetical protein
MGLGLGCIGVVLSFLPFIGIVGVIPGLLGLIFSGIGLVTARGPSRGVGLGVGGLITSVLAIECWLMMMFVGLGILADTPRPPVAPAEPGVFDQPQPFQPGPRRPGGGRRRKKNDAPLVSRTLSWFRLPA